MIKITERNEDMATIIDGKAVARDVRAAVRERAKTFFENNGVRPKLAVILAGNNPASEVYVSNKEKACGWVGIDSEVVRFPADVCEEALLSAIDRLNGDRKVNGILVQLLLPKHICAQKILNAISPDKDVDGFHPVNAGTLMQGKAALEPCTPSGCMELIRRTGVPLDGARAVVIGRSNIVGKPVALMLLRENATVTLCHSHTRGLDEIVREADVVVCATGQPGILNGGMLKSGAVVIDVGITRQPDGTLAGDADFDSVCETAGYVTPVPGGVGPMTIAMLLQNTMIAAEKQYA